MLLRFVNKNFSFCILKTKQFTSSNFAITIRIKGKK